MSEGNPKQQFPTFDLDKKALGAPPQGPDKATTQRMLIEKAAANANIPKSSDSDPIVRNPTTEVDVKFEKVEVEEKEDEPPSTPIDKKKMIIRPKSASKPKSLSREDTTQFEKDRIDEVAIHEYALNDEYYALEQLIGLRNNKTDQGKNNIRFLDSRDHHGNTALMNACWKGHVEIAEFLLKSGASKDLQNYYGWTALMWATSENKIKIVKLLLNWDVNLRIMTPVDRAAIDFAKDKDIHDLLQNVLNKPVPMLIDGGGSM